MVKLDHSPGTWGVGVGLTVVALAVFNFVPIINFITLLPTFKEILIGAAVVVFLLDTTEFVDGAAYALITGMVAAVFVNVVRLVVASVGFGLVGMDGGGMPGGVAGGVGLAALGVFVNVAGVVVFSPVGYLVGGAVGAALNDAL